MNGKDLNNEFSGKYNVEIVDIKGGNGEISGNSTLGAKTETLNIKNDSKGISDGKVTIQDDHTTNSVTINNYAQDGAKAAGEIVQGGKEGLTLTINNGTSEALGKWNGKVTGNTANNAKLVINNKHADSEWIGEIAGGKAATEVNNYGTMKTGKIGGGDGGLTINNKENAKIESAVESSGALNIVNNGTMSGEIKGTGRGATSIINNASGTISGKITMTGFASTLTNSGKITSADGVLLSGGKDTANASTLVNNHGGEITKITFSDDHGVIENQGIIGDKNTATNVAIGQTAGKAGHTIRNLTGGQIVSKIEMTKAAADGKINKIENEGLISGAIEFGGGHDQDAKGGGITNSGTISGTTLLQGKNINLTNSGSITGEITLKGGTANANEHLTITNSGSIDKITLNQANSVAHISNSGSIDKITLNQANSVAHISNSGSIGSLNFAAAGTAVLGKNFAVTLEDKASYDTNGAIKIEGTNTNSTIKLEGVSNARAAGDKAFIVNIGQGFQVGEAYDLKNFIKANAIQNAQGTSIKDTLAQSLEGRIDTTQNIYDINFSGGAMTISVEANKSIGALGAIQSIANMNSQMTRAQSIIDGVFDAVATGEIGNLPYPREGAISTQYTGASKKSKLEELAEAVESEKDPKAKEEKLALLLAEKERANKSWIGFATPYFSTSSIAATGFAATNGSAMGFVGGAAKALDNGVLFGAHIGVESQNAGKVGAEMQSLGSSFMAGVHTKMPLGQVNKASLSLVPFVKLQANAMLAANSYRLTPLMDTTREATGLVSGFSASALFGLDMPTNFGYITPEIGLMQQAVIMPELTFNSFNTAANNQTIKGTTATPMYLLAQIRYTKAIKLEKMSLFPTIKAGIRYAMAGNSFVSSINVQNGLFYATNNIDSFVGVLEAGLGAKLGQNASINLSYGGEFGAQVKTHNINVRVGWQF
ncbi:hypothetical protein HRAG_02227 [Helicobacter bilis ATCC 43879]|uniref:Autotransporter domain-containing protein n=1 Tax=Helicobacter bilis ATCC 43879 TaxID=613026 RepID=C3XJI1_9HELI|nr:hypothetical protein [Helicobacter bilis]EEO25170.2 hypothetical protein HRAG_02227 [Helicobacter bilis ATCC 43879]